MATDQRALAEVSGNGNGNGHHNGDGTTVFDLQAGGSSSVAGGVGQWAGSVGCRGQAVAHREAELSLDRSYGLTTFVRFAFLT